MAQDAAHRALRASQRAELKRLDLAAAGQEGDSLADKASSQIVTAQVRTLTLPSPEPEPKPYNLTRTLTLTLTLTLTPTLTLT